MSLSEWSLTILLVKGELIEEVAIVGSLSPR